MSVGEQLAKQILSSSRSIIKNYMSNACGNEIKIKRLLKMGVFAFDDDDAVIVRNIISRNKKLTRKVYRHFPRGNGGIKWLTYVMLDSRRINAAIKIETVIEP